MSWTKGPGDGSRKGYHHGNLKEALVEAARRLIAERGPSGFSFAEAARSAGVSPAAPYRHFRDRDELIAEVARRGFERFAAELAAAWGDGTPSAERALQRVGGAYMRFARDDPAAFAAMFEAGIALKEHPGLETASERAFGILRQACEAVVLTMPAETRPPVLMMALHVWSVAHGIAALFGRGDAARRPIPMAPEELLEAAMLVYLDGLRRPPPLRG
jgi:AcrR family transcriptional regulator